MDREHAEARLGKITSTAAAACLKYCKYNSPSMIKRRILTLADSINTPAQERGLRLEKTVLEWCAEVTGMQLLPATFRTGEEGWSGDSNDGLLASRETGEVMAVVDAKTAAFGAAGEWGEPMTDDIPTQYLIQAHWHLIHTPEVDVCYVPVLIGGYTFEYRLYVVERDKEYEAMIFDQCRKWHQQYIIEDQEPPMTDLDTERLKARWPEHDPFKNNLEATPEIARIIMRRIDLADQKKQLEKELGGLDNAMRLLLEDHEGVAGEGWLCTYRNAKPSEKTDWQALANFLDYTPKEKQQYTVTRPGARTLLIQRVKPKKRKADSVSKSDNQLTPPPPEGVAQ